MSIIDFVKHFPDKQNCKEGLKQNEMKRIYFDNSASTPIMKEVIDEMLDVLQNKYGNASSSHSFGREMKNLIENARKTIAELVGCSPSEIFFTSGGTESDNFAINAAVNDLKTEEIITSKIEHHAALEPAINSGVKISWVNFSKTDGQIDLNHLEEILKKSKAKKKLVSLMSVNNELGAITNLNILSDLCEQYGAFLHSDTVQTMGHYEIDFSKLNVSFATASGHKFHAPHGVGFLYCNGNIKCRSQIRGGGQEREMRAGTENIASIVGMAKALKILTDNLEKEKTYVLGLKKYFVESFLREIPEGRHNGSLDENENSYSLASVSIPKYEGDDMLLTLLDIEGVCVSSGSACNSGAEQASHVVQEMGFNTTHKTLRFSFSRYNTKEEVDMAIKKFKHILKS